MKTQELDQLPKKTPVKLFFSMLRQENFSYMLQGSMPLRLAIKRLFHIASMKNILKITTKNTAVSKKLEIILLEKAS